MEYKRALEPHIPWLKSQIESHGGLIVIRVSDMATALGPEFETKHYKTIYSRVKDILLEVGIKVFMDHAKDGSKLLKMYFATEDEIKTTVELSRERNIKTAINKGLEKHSEYHNEFNWSSGRHIPHTENKSCTQYFGNYIEREYVSQIFEDVKPFEFPVDEKYGVILDRHKPYDFICKQGFKIKHIASCSRIDEYHTSTSKKDGTPIPYWGYNIGFNNIPDYFILSAWNDRESLEPLYVWVIKGKEDFWTQKDSRPFYDRARWMVYATNKAIERMSQYEAKKKLNELKEICNIARK